MKGSDDYDLLEKVWEEHSKLLGSSPAPVLGN